KFNFKHAAISREDSKRFLDWAFRRDFERNGPSIYRICRTTLEGWLMYKNDADARVRARFARDARSLRDGYTAALWAMERHLAGTNEVVADKIRALRQQVEREFGLMAKVIARTVGPVMLWSARREERRLAAGQTYEPKTIIERRNWTWTAPLLPESPLAILPVAEETSAG
ncbi:MAG TPA: hypothetical protein VN792_07120, partial [Candidatus Acidoferrales bacterium]|nr:hypothetical protein [Candidatus Acidoferrales bacterium]